MKKFLALLISVLLCFSLVACGSSEKDDEKEDKKEEKKVSATFEKAEETLKDDYEVETTEDKDEISVALMMFGIEADGIEKLLIASKGDDDEHILIIAYCEDEDTAEDVCDGFNDFIDGDFEDLAKENGLDVDDYKTEQLKKAVAFGYKDYIKAAKG